MSLEELAQIFHPASFQTQVSMHELFICSSQSAEAVLL